MILCLPEARVPGTIGLKPMRIRVLGIVLAGGKGTRLSPAHQGTGQTGRSVWRQVPDHRFRAEQFHQLGDLLHLCADAVPQPVAAAAPERGLAVRRPAEEPVHDPGAGADALGGRNLVPGHGRRHLSEHQSGGAVRPARGGHLRRRSHLPHEHRQHDRIPRGQARRSHRGRDPVPEEARRRNSA